MIPYSSILVAAVLLVVGIGWCAYIVRRLPADLAELREQWAKLRASKTPEVTRKFETLVEVRRYQKECAAEFWSTLVVQACFFWPLTILVIAFFLVPTLWSLASRILGAFR